jgi:hypothetical protein
MGFYGDEVHNPVLPLTAGVKIFFNFIAMQTARRSRMVHKHRRDFMLQGNEEFLQNTGRKTKM